MVGNDAEMLLTFVETSLWQDSFVFLNDFYQSGKFCDVELDVCSVHIKWHRIILACVIPYFRSVFASEFNECRQEVILIQDMRVCIYIEDHDYSGQCANVAAADFFHTSG